MHVNAALCVQYCHTAQHTCCGKLPVRATVCLAGLGMVSGGILYSHTQVSHNTVSIGRQCTAKELGWLACARALVICAMARMQLDPCTVTW